MGPLLLHLGVLVRVAIAGSDRRYARLGLGLHGPVVPVLPAPCASRICVLQDQVLVPSFLHRRVELELLRRVGLNRAGVQVVILSAFEEHRMVFVRVVSLVEGLIRESFSVPEFVQRVLPRLEPTIGRSAPKALEVERVREDVRFSPAR